MKFEDYTVKVDWDDRESQFIATVKELPTVSAHGTTREEAIQALRTAVEGCLRGMDKIGLARPRR